MAAICRKLPGTGTTRNTSTHPTLRCGATHNATHPRFPPLTPLLPHPQKPRQTEHRPTALSAPAPRLRYLVLGFRHSRPHVTRTTPRTPLPAPHFSPTTPSSPRLCHFVLRTSYFVLSFRLSPPVSPYPSTLEVDSIAYSGIILLIVFSQLH